MFVEPDFFKWKCANVLIGEGDSYSSAGAAAFQKAAKKNGINVCMTSSYTHNSADMEDTIHDIMDERCCLLTVVFAQPKDIVSILLEAHRQHYAGEWLMGETVIDSQTYITTELKKRLGDTSAVYPLMRGKDELTPLLAYGSRAPISRVLYILHPVVQRYVTLSFVCTTCIACSIFSQTC